MSQAGPSTLRPLRTVITQIPSQSSTPAFKSRSFSFSPISRKYDHVTQQWPSRTHLAKPPTIPPPIPALYKKQIILSDGSTFTSHMTSPSPQIIRLTRDVTNNPLWSPSTEKNGVGEGEEEGRVGRFRRRFDMSGMAGRTESNVEGSKGGKDGKETKEDSRAFGMGDLDWMSEGAIEEKIGGKSTPAAGKGKKK